MSKRIAKNIFVQDLDEYEFRVYDSKPDIVLEQVNQVHEAVIAETPCSTEIDADGVLTYENDKVLAIKTADCLPVAFKGHEGISLVHAGWRGVAKKILMNKLLKPLKVETIFIGPCIRSCCFEVQADFKQNFPESNNFEVRNDKLYFNLASEAAEQMKKEFPEAVIIDSNSCTMCDKKFHSYRRDKTQERNWNILAHKDILKENEENI